MAPKSPWNKKTSNVNTNVQRAASEASPPATTINYDEAQREECEVLQAIYMEDYEEVETRSAWSKTTDRSFKLTLRSLSDHNSFVVLSVRMTATYPKTAPILDVSGLANYHERTQQRIRNILNLRPKQLLGEVMIHSIASEIQDALEDAVSARQQGTLFSLEEERANAKEMANVLAKEQEDADAQRQLEEKKAEDEALKQMVEAELHRREKRKPSKSSAENTPNMATDVLFDQPAKVQAGHDEIEFNAVSFISLLSQQRNVELHLGRPRAAGDCPLVAVKKLTVRKPRDEIMAIESALESVSKIRHSNLLGLLAYRVDRVDAGVSQVTMCSEYADRGTLRELLDFWVRLDTGKARQFTIELLEGLDYLHYHGVAHGAVSASSIYMRSTPSLSPKLGQLGQWMLQTPHAHVSVR
jgi:eukaryotic translation initiation factor 2-alpha kinase 4